MMHQRWNDPKYQKAAWAVAMVCAAALALPCRAMAEEGAAAKPNILWIIAEDISPDLQCYGNCLIHTPNLDRLAAEGSLFTRAYTTSPICSPSRSAFNTGMYQTFLGAHHHRTPADAAPVLPSGVKLISHRLREGGYFTANVRQFPEGVDVSGTGKTDWNFQRPERQFDSHVWADLKDHQPFYAQVNLRVTKRRWPTESPNSIDAAKVVLPPYIPDHPVMRADRANYLEVIQRLDEQVGLILKQLDKDGLLDNTIVFFFSDHGPATERGKGTLFEPGIHVPLIVRWPGHVAPGSVCHDLVSIIDLVPTALVLAGLPVPPGMHGQTFLVPGSKRREYVFAARDRAEESVDRVRCVITDRYKYNRNFMPDVPARGRTRWNEKPGYNPQRVLMLELKAAGKLTPAQSYHFDVPRPTEELYDLQADPHEMHNLAGSPEFQDVMKEMRAQLDAWIRSTDDKGATPEDPAIVKRIEDEWNKRFGPLKKYGP